MTWLKKVKSFLGFKEEEHCICMVISEQEGAEIWINQKKTAFVTPKLVALPLNKETLLTLKLTGHHDHQAYVRSKQALTYYNCKLERIPLRVIRNEEPARAAL